MSAQSHSFELLRHMEHMMRKMQLLFSLRLFATSMGLFGLATDRGETAFMISSDADRLLSETTVQKRPAVFFHRILRS